MYPSTETIEAIDTEQKPLEQLDKYIEKNCNGHYLDTNTKTEYNAEFEYKEYESSAISVLKGRTLTKEKRESLEKTYIELGLSDISFRCFSRDEKFKENISTKNVYVLTHGWTGNKDIYSKVKMEGEVTIVEQIMAMDPDALIITPDGNGFGDSNFRSEVTNSENFGNYCDAESYAKQINFLIQDVLEIDPSTVTIAGHSMGGALTYEIMEYGYKNGVAIAPAAFPSVEYLKDLKKQIDIKDIPNILKKYNINLSAALYNLISGGVGLGQGIRNISGKLAEPLIDGIINKAFQFIAPHLIGKDLPDSTLESLLKIHSNEVTPEKYKVVKEALKQLGKGIDYSRKNPSSSSRVISFAGTNDVLVQPDDYITNERALLAKAVGTKYEPDVANRVKENLSENNTIEGGHYAPLYNPKVITAIVNCGKRS